MISPSSAQLLPLLLLISFLLFLRDAHAVQYKVGDLNSWGLPPSSNPNVYDDWSKLFHFAVDDSLLFLYPPSQDSVIQVTEHAYRRCRLAVPVLKLDDGNSVFNLTAPGWYYFTSGVPGHCQKGQKLAVVVPLADGSIPPAPADGPDAADSFAPAGAPAGAPAFGPSAADKAGSPRAAELGVSVAVGSVLALAFVGVFGL